MSLTSLDGIVLTGSQRPDLARFVRAGCTEQRLARRAAIVLAVATGASKAQIAASRRVCEDTVRKWRRRWCGAPGLASLAERNAPVAHLCSAPCRSPGSGRWPARRPRTAG